MVKHVVCIRCGENFETYFFGKTCNKCKRGVGRSGYHKARRKIDHLKLVARAEGALAKADGVWYRRTDGGQADRFDFAIQIPFVTKMYSCSVGGWRKRAALAMIEEDGGWKFYNRCWRRKRDRKVLKGTPVGRGLSSYDDMSGQDECSCPACETAALLNNLVT